ncbi:MAG TPA: hypothetical protein VEJ36_02575 [Nitrososphaerales archaeon]|nr:hypothetical protein [Nitrososphaerales archaeon]
MRTEKRAVSTAVIAVIVVVIVVVAGVGFYLASRSSSTTTTTTTPTTSSTSTSTTTTASSNSTSSSFSASTGNNSAVLSQINLFVQAFNDRAVESLSNFYTSSSVDNWEGTTQGLGGVYNGQGNIRILYDASIAKTTSLSAVISKLTMVTLSPSEVNATFVMHLNGASPALGNITAVVNVTQQWENEAGTWYINSEVWNYQTFTASNPLTSTVFPQWGLQIAGENPNLASEHAFEWHFAPFVALGLYVSILLIVVVAFIYRRPRRSPESQSL